jgi:predicted phosphoribosyltransferase
MTAMLQNRRQAGQMLAAKLKAYANRPDVLVLALPRGGVPVAFEIAKALNLPLDVCLVRKLGTPGKKELAMGAIAMGGVVAINHDVVDWLKIPPEVIEQAIEQEEQELARRDRAYRGDRPLPAISDRTIILVDDGIATGSTLRAAITALKQQQPKAIIVAVPVAPPATCQDLKAEVDQVVCLSKPDPFYSISLWYEDFSQTSDSEVRDLLAQAEQQLAAMN